MMLSTELGANELDIGIVLYFFRDASSITSFGVKEVSMSKEVLELFLLILRWFINWSCCCFISLRLVWNILEGILKFFNYLWRNLCDKDICKLKILMLDTIDFRRDADDKVTHLTSHDVFRSCICSNWGFWGGNLSCWSVL